MDGYCIRSKEIVDFQRSIGLDVQVLTSAQHEIEVERAAGAIVESETIDGVRYTRTPLPDGPLSRAARRTPFARETVMMTALGRALGRLLSRESVDVIHVHSPVLCGLSSTSTARSPRPRPTASAKP